MKPIVQCVPNFSEGCDLDKIERIVAPLKNQPGFTLVSYEPDKDYNRTVVTLLGDPESMIEPLLKSIEITANEIDLNHQCGEHPRMGAIDVLPFIPIQNITMETCVDYAKRIGKLIYDRFQIPVFLYAEAAQEARRKKLPNIRKGEFEGMKEKIKHPDWHPDFGTAEMHPTAGVIGVGARLPLIAYNIDLDTMDLSIAKQISKAIRGSSGGFKHVQAGPVCLEERKHTQVTMNILNYKQNPLYRIYETVKMEAKRYGVHVTGSEVVGLIPQDTLMASLEYYGAVEQFSVKENTELQWIVQASIQYLKLRDFNASKIIEANL